MPAPDVSRWKRAGVNLSALVILVALAYWVKGGGARAEWQYSGVVDFTLGFALLAAYLSARVSRTLGLPLISGYIFTGMVIGPYGLKLLTASMVRDLKLVDDLALSFIALSAGGALHAKFLARRAGAIALNVVLLTLVVFAAVFLFVVLAGPLFGFTRVLSPYQVTALAVLLGVVAVARSPSSAMAVISETRAKGPFTETVLGVTVVMDVLIIILFTVALAVTHRIVCPEGSFEIAAMLPLVLETAAALGIGLVLGKGIAWYLDGIGRDRALFLLFFGFTVTELSYWLSGTMMRFYGTSVHLEPLLICMSAGFTVQNFSRSGVDFMEHLDRFALPIYVLFFSLAGASLNMDALMATWPLAVCLAVVRCGGIFGATYLAGTVSGDPPAHRRVAWMSYLTQAGVAIGLAQLAERQFPALGVYMTTVVLSVITINQIVGPISFKVALTMVREAGKR